jgi:DNA-directed RNA polymerase specialized sigma24 family protein
MSAVPKTRHSSQPLDDTTAHLIRKKAGLVAHVLGLPRADVPDVEQDIAAHVWPRLAVHDPARLDRGAFVRMLVAHAAATSIRDQRRRVRKAPASLDAVLASGQFDEPVDARTPGDVGLALDVDAILAALPRRLRRVADALKTNSVAATARNLGLSRAEVYRRMSELREHLADLRP